eukprot:scaffold34887_cov61-Phaeocystis_antarctica.AAC.7
MSAVLRNRFVGCRGSGTGCQTANLSSKAVKKSKIASTTDRVTYHTRCSRDSRGYALQRAWAIGIASARGRGGGGGGGAPATAAAIAPQALAARELGVVAPRVARRVAPLAEARGQRQLLAVRGPADEVSRLDVVVALGDEKQRAAGGAVLATQQLEGAARPGLR